MGNKFSLERINLAELERRAGVTRVKLRRLKKMGSKENPYVLQRCKACTVCKGKLSGGQGVLERYGSEPRCSGMV